MLCALASGAEGPFLSQASLCLSGVCFLVDTLQHLETTVSVVLSTHGSLAHVTHRHLWERSRDLQWHLSSPNLLRFLPLLPFPLSPEVIAHSEKTPHCCLETQIPSSALMLIHCHLKEYLSPSIKVLVMPQVQLGFGYLWEALFRVTAPRVLPRAVWGLWF